LSLKVAKYFTSHHLTELVENLASIEAFGLINKELVHTNLDFYFDFVLEF